MDSRFLQARTEEIKYHEKFYAEHELFAPGTWIAKPVQAIMDTYVLLEPHGMRVLDLGCGVGRNAIPIAQAIKAYSGKVTAVDLLPSAVAILQDNAEKYEVKDNLEAIAADIEYFQIPSQFYDYIIACSSLEHVSSVDAFRTVIGRMIEGTRPRGIHAILMSTQTEELDYNTGVVSEGLIELNLSTDDAFFLLRECYNGWEIVLERVIPQAVQEVKYGKSIEYRGNWLTFIVRRTS
ncbi:MULTISPECIES: class I SAM-dependent methyltransferase [unclassified Paenibacillus]|uniref:class I SAM-dependent methyltransferase n=1 Tax=unclassified Paenibacillus TaxID=185978 RepID=UPI00104BDBCD|nr:MULTISPECIES: class I SAM-dependent methyltransferase [unclassified Paenibacillus]NIK68406.1 cyclopropane fatty-acyl-phospholipid synthase-like methyltransferase [Paenibacillus sp. BK720]